MYKKIIAVLVSCVALSAVSEAATYYVSPTGTATWANCTNINTPCSWKTALANAVAGDIVNFRGGIYEPGASSSDPAMNPRNSGTAGNPITFMAYPGETATIRDAVGASAIGASQRNYIIWDGFTLDRNLDDGLGASSIVVIDSSSNIIIRNNNMIGRPHRDHTNGTLIAVSSGTNIDIYNNKLHGKSADPNPVESVENASAIWVFDARQVNIYNNDIYDNNIGIAWKVDPNNISVYQNYFYNCKVAVKVHPQTSNNTDYFIYQNIARNCRTFVEASDAVANPFRNLKVYNNTVYNASSGEGVIIGSLNLSNSRDAEVFNNIFSFGGTSSLFVNYYSGASFPAFADYNLFYGAGHWDLGYQVSYNSLSAWRTVSGADLHSITANPLFVNAGSANPEDYRLASNSPAKGTGRNGEDMGAFVNGFATKIGYRSPSRPAPPQNLTVTSPDGK